MTASTEARIWNVYQRLTARECIAGIFWYPLAFESCERIGQLANRPAVRVAGVVAARSPRASWQGNLTTARRDCLTGRATGSLFSVRAQAILDGARIGSVLTGRKTRAFFASIVRRGRTHHVAVDIWILRLIYGSDGEGKRMIRQRGEYDRVSDAFRNVAVRQGLDAATLQASVWIGVRGGAL